MICTWTTRGTLFLCLFCAAAPVHAVLPTLFGELSTDKDGIYQNEPFHLVLSVFVSGETLDKPLSLDGLPPQDQAEIQPYEELAAASVVREGRSYDVRKYRWAVRVRKPGPLTLRLGLQGSLLRVTQNYIFTQTSRQTVRIPVEELTLAIRPLPADGRPSGFSGAVGTFTFQAVAAPLDVAVGDLITLTYTLSGDPLPDAFTPPSVRSLSSLRVYETKAVEQDGAKTARVFRQTLVPTDTSVAAIPAVSFSYFDGRQNAYRTVSVGPFPLTFYAERTPVQQIYSPTGETARTQALHHPFVQPLPGAAAAEGAWFGSLWRRLVSRHEVIVGSGGAIARLTPSENAQPLFKLKPGLRIELDSEWRDWVRISCPDGIGWVPAAAIVSE